MRVAVVIPALNEEDSLPGLLAAIAPEARVVVVDNGSTDRTAEVARENGAEVVHQPERGYGNAVLAGMAHLAADPPDVMVVLDADHADDPRLLPMLVEPIRRDVADLVQSERTHLAEPGSLTPVQRFGNRLTTGAILVMTGHRFRDMGPFRAIRWESLQRLEMCDPNYGWNVEMQLKAVRRGLRIQEISLPYRNRTAGVSKVSGSVRGAARASVRIVASVWRYRHG